MVRREHGRSVAPEVARLAAGLWQSIPHAAQRRLGELLGQTPPTFDSALEGARQVARRAGLYLSGDLAAAVRGTLAEGGEEQNVGDGSVDLAIACAHHPKVADLFRLATSPRSSPKPAGASRSRRVAVRLPARRPSRPAGDRHVVADLAIMPPWKPRLPTVAIVA